MEEITPQQKEQLNTWASQRDAILLEISSLKTLQESLLKKNKEIAVSNIDIEQRIQQSIGRISEIEKSEKDNINKISLELTQLISTKTEIESYIDGLRKSIKELIPQKDSLLKDIYLLTEVYNTINDRVGVLDKVVDHVTKVSEQNKFVIEEIVDSIKKSSQKVVDLNEKNVKATNLVLEKLPAMLVELQRTKLIRNKIL